MKRKAASVSAYLYYLIHTIFRTSGAIAQLGERLVCIQEVCGSIPHGSTKFLLGLEDNVL